MQPVATLVQMCVALFACLPKFDFVVGAGHIAFMDGALLRCSNEGEEISTSHIRDSQCYHCICQNNTAVCTQEKCPSLNTCPLVERNQASVCCKKCKTCNYLGQTYQNNEQWLSGQDSCRTLTCKGGVITQARMQCVAQCSHPQRLVGFCCPVCPSSELFVFNSNKLIEQKDPCVQCQCDTRWCHCFRTACPALDCQPEDQHVPSGSCCPECRVAREAKTVPDGCVFQNMAYLNEQSFRPDPCTLCKCQDGSVICRRFLCPAFQCPKNRLYYEKNLCCPRCRNRDPSPCTYERKEYKHGDVWNLDSCTKCICANGETICSTMQCPFSRCPKGYKLTTPVKGQCCGVCEEKEATCTVFGDPHYQTFDGRTYNFQGTCRYVLAKNCHSKKSASQFSIVVQNEPRGQEQYTWTRHVSLRLASGVRVALLPGKRVRLNRTTLKLPYIELGVFSVMIDKQDNVLLRVVDGPKVVWDGNSYVEVTVSSNYRKTMCGLCGNYNGNPEDDFQLLTEPNDLNDRNDLSQITSSSSLVVTKNINAFGQSWRVGSWKACKSNKDRLYHQKTDKDKRAMRKSRRKNRAKSAWNLMNGLETNEFVKKPSPYLFSKAPTLADILLKRRLTDNEEYQRHPVEKVERKRRRMRKLCPDNKYETRKASVDRCELLKAPLFGVCHSLVNVRHYYRSCVMDSCACPPTGRCYCEAMLAYARKCEKENILIDWREKANCVAGTTTFNDLLLNVQL